MEKKIGDIKNELMAANESELPVFVERYAQDERSGVKALVTRAQKRMKFNTMRCLDYHGLQDHFKFHHL